MCTGWYDKTRAANQAWNPAVIDLFSGVKLLRAKSFGSKTRVDENRY